MTDSAVDKKEPHADQGASLTIVQVIDHLGPGGAQRQFVELAIGLRKRGHSLVVVALNDQLTDFLPPLVQAGIDVRLVAQQGKFDLNACVQLFRIFRDVRPAIVQTWLFTADMYARPCAKLSRILNMYSCKIISSVRSAETDKKPHYVWVDRILRFMTDAFVVNAAVLADTLHSREKVARNKIHTIYNGIDFDYFSGAKSEQKLKTKEAAKVTIGFIGRLSPEKRPDLFIRAAAEIYKCNFASRFVMVGSGDTEPYQGLVDGGGLQEVLTFEHSTDDIAPLLSDIDILVSCSDYEGCSNTILEAMAARIVVVATDVGGNRELLRKDGGILVLPDNALAISRAVLAVLEEPGPSVEAVTIARERVKTEFSRPAMIHAHESLYHSLL